MKFYFTVVSALFKSDSFHGRANKNEAIFLFNVCSTGPVLHVLKCVLNSVILIKSR